MIIPIPADISNIRVRGGRLLAVLLLTLLMAALAAFPAWAEEPALAEEPIAAEETTSIVGPLNFDQCADLAIKQSPYFTKSSLEIKVRKLDESDAKWSYIPDVVLRTTYYVNVTNRSGNNSKPQNAIVFTTGNFDPVRSYYTVKARKMITDIAVQGHLKVISKGLYELGKKFAELESLDQAAEVQEQAVKQARQQVSLARQGLAGGTASPLEVKIAEQELEMTRFELERLQDTREMYIQGLSDFLGLHSGELVDLDTTDAGRQVLEDFNPKSANFVQARKDSPEMKIQALKQKLQSFRVTMAYAEFIPKLSFGFSNPDPLSFSSSEDDMFVSLSLDIPLWDGMRRPNDVTRQKTILRQYASEAQQSKHSFKQDWMEAENQLKAARQTLKLAEGAEKLSRLQLRRSEISHGSGSTPLSTLMADRKNYLGARKAHVQARLNYTLAALELRYLTGDLLKRYVAEIRTWED